ncbi:hypothetical protein KIL84_016280 [Mauremys mutica]|uniref:Uncharacterized protein n=1 Tax=Mauremys mutica TaxID=74926 RepID=A0A9D3WTL7_9SAUR|nr:hypothetical protein KIL84_016280 [Mauremys mutica]
MVCEAMEMLQRRTQSNRQDKCSIQFTRLPSHPILGANTKESFSNHHSKASRFCLKSKEEAQSMWKHSHSTPLLVIELFSDVSFHSERAFSLFRCGKPLTSIAMLM